MTDFQRHLVEVLPGEYEAGPWAISKNRTTEPETWRVWFLGRKVEEGFVSVRAAVSWCKRNWRQIEKRHTYEVAEHRLRSQKP